MSYRVTHGYVTVPFEQDGSVAHRDIRQGETLPDDTPAEYVRMLLARGHIEATDGEGDAPPADLDGDGVPDGSAAQVLAWVNGDPGRARVALNAENAKEQPRASLVGPLTKLIPTESE